MAYSRIFISPHPDDIAYSCFGTIFNTKCTFSTDLLVTVLTRSVFPKYDIKEKPDTQKIDTFSKVRIDEDKNFCDWLKCHYEALCFPDSSIREKSDDRMNIKIYTKLKEIIKENIDSNVYIPLACTNHEDHLLVRNIVVQIFNNCRFSMKRLFFYEDLPYANSLSKYKLKKHLDEINIEKDKYKFKSILVDVDTCWQEKIEAFHIYATQKLQNHLESITQHADMIGKDRKVERLWKIVENNIQDSRNFAWVSWEASRAIGGIGAVMNNIFKTEGYKKSAHRTILIGPMHMPLNVEPQTERISEIAMRLNSRILYAYGDCVEGLSKETIRKLKLAEETYGVGIAYLRDYPRIDNPQTVERILIDFSCTVTKTNVYSISLKYFLRDLDTKLGLDIAYDRTDEKELFNENRKYNYDDELKQMIARLRDNVSSKYNHIDNDSIYGLLIAKPAIDALNAILKSNEICILNTMDYFSLPTAYAAILDRTNGEVTSFSKEDATTEYKKYKIRTHYLASEIKPIRSIAERYITVKGTVQTMVPEYGSELLVRCLVKKCIDGETRLSFADLPGLEHINTHPPVQLLRKIHLLDFVSAISEQVRDELMAINPKISSIEIAPHGNRYIDLGRNENKLYYKGKVLAKLCTLIANEGPDEAWTRFSNTICIGHTNVVLSIHIARPEYCKKLERDIQLLYLLKDQQKLLDKKIIHLFIGSFNQNYSKNYSEYLKEKVKKINKEANNVYCRIINDPAWPCYLDETNKDEILTRDDLYRAADLNFGLSSYDSYGLSPLESLSCGTISVISSASGSTSYVSKCKSYEKNIVIIDYHSDFCKKHYNSEDTPLKIEDYLWSMDNEHPSDRRTFLECTVDYNNHLAAGKIAGMLPLNDESVLSDLVKSGENLSKEMSWENIIDKFFLSKGKPFQELFTVTDL